jgi:hypothetical protein
MKIPIFFSVIFTLFSLTMTAQKFMIGYGFSAFTDVAFLETDPLVQGAESTSDVGFSIVTASVEMKFNVYEFNSDMALSVASSPAVGLMSFGQVGGVDAQGNDFGHFRIPFYAQFDYGNLSTFESLKNFGVGIGLGYQFGGYSIFSPDYSIGGNGLVGRLGFRYFNRNNAAREIALKYEFPREVDIETDIFLDGDLRSVEGTGTLSSVALSFILYFNY